MKSFAPSKVDVENYKEYAPRPPNEVDSTFLVPSLDIHVVCNDPSKYGGSYSQIDKHVSGHFVSSWPVFSTIVCRLTADTASPNGYKLSQMEHHGEHARNNAQKNLSDTLDNLLRYIQGVDKKDRPCEEIKLPPDMHELYGLYENHVKAIVTPSMTVAPSSSYKGNKFDPTHWSRYAELNMNALYRKKPRIVL
mmetsp:Transcript_8134/g.20413  ORF Transcript_8134/g.20413 Transcript_8134/m.20413 type:complete len:193 (+) Transcript_8134:1182-1760(+)